MHRADTRSPILTIWTNLGSTLIALIVELNPLFKANDATALIFLDTGDTGKKENKSN